MSLFGFFAEAALLPVKVTAAAVKAPLKATGRVLGGDLEGAVDELGNTPDDVERAFDRQSARIEREIDET